MAIQDGVTPFNAANVPHKSGDDVITGNWKTTKPLGTAGGVNYVRNGNLEAWIAGATSAPTGWTLTGGGATIARDSTNRKVGSFAAALTRVGTDCYLSQNAVTLQGPAAWWQGKKVTFGCWVRATVATRARLQINDGVGTASSAYHTGSGAFEWIEITRDIDAAATQVELRLVVDTGNTTAQFDGATLVLGAGVQDFIPAIVDVARGDEPATVAEQWQFTQPIGNAGSVSWLYNGDMEVWGQPPGSVIPSPTGWALTGAGASCAKNTSNVKIGTASAAVTRAGTNCYISQNIAALAPFGPVARWQGKRVTLGCWLRSTVASAARLTINDGVGTSSSPTHSGSGAFEWLQVSRTLDAAATVVELRLEVIVDTTVQFDGATFVLGASVQDFIPSTWRGRKATILCGNAATQASNTTNYYGPWGNSGTESLASFRVPYKCVARRLHALTDQPPAAGQSVTLTLRFNEAQDTVLTATVTNASRFGEDVTNEVLFASGDMVSMKVVTSATSGARAPHASFEIEEVPA